MERAPERPLRAESPLVPAHFSQTAEACFGPGVSLCSDVRYIVGLISENLKSHSGLQRITDMVLVLSWKVISIKSDVKQNEHVVKLTTLQNIYIKNLHQG